MNEELYTRETMGRLARLLVRKWGRGPEALRHALALAVKGRGRVEFVSLVQKTVDGGPSNELAGGRA